LDIDNSDLYCNLGVFGRHLLESTPSIQNPDEPTWNQEFAFEVLAYDSDILAMKISDQGVVTHDKIGKLFIQISGLPPGEVVDCWDPLTKTKRAAMPSEIHLVLHVVRKSTPLWENAPFTALVAKVTIAEARDLPKTDAIGKSDPLAIAKFGHSPRPFVAKVRDNTLASRWGESTMWAFKVTSLERDAIHIQVKDKDISVDDLLRLGTLGNARKK
jgi:Ca2+-dependent lipid-binding protein